METSFPWKRLMAFFFFWTLKSFLRKRTLTLTETAANKNVEIHAYDPAGQYLAVKET